MKSLTASAAARRREVPHASDIIDRLGGALAPAKFERLQPSKAKSGRTYIRLIVPDLHGNWMDRRAVEAFLADARLLSDDVREIVILGDLVEAGGWLAGNHTLGYTAEVNQTSYRGDISAANGFLDALISACPTAEIHYVEGNHEHRTERWATTVTLAHGTDAAYLHDLISPFTVLRLSERGIHYYQQHIDHGCGSPGVIKRGRCLFTHGPFAGRMAAYRFAEKYGTNICFGHIHRQTLHVASSVHSGQFISACPGTLSQRQRIWQHSDPSDWTCGFGFQSVDVKTEDFVHLNVPIINGRSYLSPLLDRMRR